MIQRSNDGSQNQAYEKSQREENPGEKISRQKGWSFHVLQWEKGGYTLCPDEAEIIAARAVRYRSCPGGETQADSKDRRGIGNKGKRTGTLWTL
jgi:hypothetical protein